MGGSLRRGMSTMPAARPSPLPAMTASRLLLAACLLAAFAPGARAELPAEIRVYDDSLDDPGEFGFEIHSSRTFQRSRRHPAHGELASDRGWRVTPEISYGINEHTEVSLLFPTVVDAAGNAWLGGQQLQLKWLPFLAPAEGGFFAGVNWELVTATRRFDERRNSVEIRPILGYRDGRWTAIVNFLTSYGLTRGHRQGGFDFDPAFKVSRAVGAGVHLGVEYFTEVGKLARFAPHAEQDHMAYLTVDVARAGWKINLGVGRGLNSATDPWMLKTIIEFPLDD